MKSHFRIFFLLAGLSAFLAAPVAATAAQELVGWTAGSGTDTNWSTAHNWTNFTAGGFGPPGTNNGVLFTNTAAVTASALTSPGSGVLVPANITSTVDASIAIGGLTNLASAISTSPVYHNIGIARGAVLTNGGLQVGGFTAFNHSDNNVVNLTISGAGGTLLLNGGGVTVSENCTNAGGNNAVLDLSGLDAFTMNGTQIRVGIEGGSGFRRASGIVYLARTNVLTLTTAGYSDSAGTGSPSSGNPALYIGHNASAFGNGSRLYLGISNSLALDYATIGRGDINALLAFNPAFSGSNPAATIRGTNGGSSRVGVYVVGDGSAGAQSTVPSTNDFSGGTVDAMINYLCVGRGRSGTNTTATGGSGVLTFDRGIINANTLDVGFIYPYSSNSVAIGTVNVSGTATLVVNSNLNLVSQAWPAIGAVGQGTLGIYFGGTVRANTIKNGGGVATVTVNTGTLILTNTMGTPTTGISTFNVIDAALHLRVDANVIATNIIATNFHAGGVTTIYLDSILNVTQSNRFPLINYSLINGDVGANLALGPLPGYYDGGLSNNAVDKTIDLILVPKAPPPVISGIEISGSHLILRGSNGTPSVAYQILTTTNVALPLVNWTSSGSNVFDGNGRFVFTNQFDPLTPWRFYLLKSP